MDEQTRREWLGGATAAVGAVAAGRRGGGTTSRAAGP